MNEKLIVIIAVSDLGALAIAGIIWWLKKAVPRICLIY
jgi:hypothetical protein